MRTHAESQFNGMNINCDSSGNRNCRSDILEAIYDRLTDMNSRHSKTLFVRFDLRYPQGNFPQVATKTSRRLSTASQYIYKGKALIITMFGSESNLEKSISIIT